MGPAALSAKPALLDKLVFRIVTDDSGRYNALQSGQLQIAMNLPPNDIAAAQKSGRFKQLTVQSIGTPLGMPINVTKPPTDDPLVRQAIMYAVNQDVLVKQVLFGVDTPAHTVLTPITPGYSKSSGDLYSYDPAKANALLDQAGWKMGARGPHQERREARARHHPVRRLRPGDADRVRGVRAEQGRVHGLHDGPAVRHRAGVLQLRRAQPRRVRLLRHRPLPAQHLGNSDAIKSGFNWSHYDNPSLDAMIAKANRTADATARDALYEQVCTTLMKDAVYLPLWNVNDPFTMTPGVTGLHTTLNGYITFHSAGLS